MNTRIIRLAVLWSLLLSCPALLAQEYTLLVFGDSLSAAYGMEEEQGWVYLLAEKLQDEDWPVEVINGSVSGETTTGGRQRLPAMLDTYQPDLVILELGGNDGLRGLPIAFMRSNLAEMIDLVEANGALVLLAGIQIPPNYGPRYTLPFMEAFPQLAAEKQVALVPFLIEGIPENGELMQNDGIHPRAEAQHIIVDNVWEFLQPLLQELIASP
ncbi:MAG: arylesterase [Gammaproteobacteria bacterium]